VSEDLFGAGAAIFWTFYNMALMLAVLRIGTRPPEKRGGSRFRVNFAVERVGEGGQLGVTADISDGGCSLLWPEPLPAGHRMPLRLHFGVRSAEWMCEVASDGGQQPDGWYSYGVRFLDLQPADVDLINDSIFSLVIPDLFSSLGQRPRLARMWRGVVRWWERHAHHRAPRRDVRVPVRVAGPAGPFVTTIRDLSTTGLSLASPGSIGVGATLRLEMFAPGHTSRGQVVVARSEERRSRPGFDTWILGLRFDREQAAGVELFARRYAA
jgi:hypothetical protein